MSKNQKPGSGSSPQERRQVGKQGCSVKVTIGRVIRGNPYVDRNVKPLTGLPDSVPPNQTYQVEIRVEPALEKACPDDFIEVSIAGCGDENGTATVAPTKITQTTTVTVTGGKQTVPRHGGNLKIQASLGGKKVLALSPGFTVCAHPLNFKDVFDSNIEDELQEKHVIGMKSQDSWESDSGTAAVGGILADLNKVQIKELLLEPRPKPPFHPHPFDHSDYELGNAFSTDRHAILYPDAGPKGDWTIYQLSVFKCGRCGCKDIVMPNSGLQISFHVVNGNGWQFFVEKVGAKVMVNGFSSAAAEARIKTDPVPLIKQ